MKKILFVLLVCLFVILSFGKDKLHIFIWSVYMPDEVIENFEQEYDCDVIIDLYDSNEAMYTKLRAGATGYDIAFPSGDYVSIMSNQGMLTELNHEKLPNLKNLDPEILAKAEYDAGQKYSVPFQMGTTGIAVNEKYLKDYPKSWSIFLDENLKGKMTLLDDMREVFGGALRYLGYSVNTTDLNELNEAKDLIMKWKSNIAKFDNEFFGKGIISGEFYAVHGYSENIFFEGSEGETEDINYFIPEEGAVLWIDSMVILENAPNKDLAHEFINFVLRPESAKIVSEYLELPTPNMEGRKLVDETDYIYTYEDLKNCEAMLDVGEALRTYNNLWNEIRFGF